MDSLKRPSWNTLEITEQNKNDHEILEVLQLAHDKMDEDNNKIALGKYCRWCMSSWGYNENGIHHEDDCVLIRIRKLVVLQ